MRVKSRREIIEDREREMERHRDAVEGLLLLGDSQFMCEAGTQTAALEVQCTETQTPKSTTSSETQTSPLTFRYSEIASNDEAVKFYTGLPTCSVFEQVLAHLLSCSSPTLAVKSHTATNVRLCDADRLLLTLMRLRLGLLVQDLAYRFGISESTVSDIFLAWIDAMYCSFKISNKVA